MAAWTGPDGDDWTVALGERGRQTAGLANRREGMSGVCVCVCVWACVGIVGALGN